MLELNLNLDHLIPCVFLTSVLCCLRLNSPVPGVCFPLSTWSPPGERKGFSLFLFCLPSPEPHGVFEDSLSNFHSLQAGVPHAERQELWVSVAMSLRALCWGDRRERGGGKGERYGEGGGVGTATLDVGARRSQIKGQQ